MNCTIPSQKPSFPSLYNPLLENWKDRCNQDPRVVYLYDSGGVQCSLFSLIVRQLTANKLDIFRFTLYWTLLIYLFLFGLPGLWALLVHLLPRWRRTPSNDGTALYRIPSTPRNHPAHSSTSLGNLSPPSPAFSPSPHTSSVEAQVTTQASTSGHLRFTAPSPPTPVSSAPATQAWDSWTPSIRLRNLRSRSFSANVPQDNETQSTSLSPPTSQTPFSLSYIPASRPASFIPVNATPPVTRPNTSSAPIRLPPRLPRFRKPPKANLILVLLIPLVFVLIGALIGVLGSLVLGYLLAALSHSVPVRISTWLPLGWAVIQALVILSG